MTCRSNVATFKNLLRNHAYVCARCRELTVQLNELWARLGARPKGIDPSRERTHAYIDPAIAHDIREAISDLEAKISPWRAKRDEVEYLLGRIESPAREAVIEVFVNGRTMESVARENLLSKSTLDSKMNQAIKKALTDW